MKHRSSWTTNVLMVCAILLTVACAHSSSRALPDANTASVLDGHWQIDKLRSDDVRARLTPLFEKDERNWRRHADRLEEPMPRPDGLPNGDDGISHIRWIEHERQKEMEALIAILSPANRLEFTHTDRSIRITNDKGEGTRSLTPGEESSLFLSVGGFSVTSSWEKGHLVIESIGSGENKLRIVERYTSRGDVLEEHLEVKIPGLGKHSFAAIYQRVVP